MIDAERLLADTKKQVVALVDDIRAVVRTDAGAATHVTTEYQRAHAAGRTAFAQAEWAEGLFAQVAVAWVLGCVFVRFCEDNQLIDDPLLGGPGIRSQIALDHRAAHLRDNPAHDDRHWLREVFDRLRELPATGEIFGAHNPVWADDLLPSADAARQLRDELTRLDPASGDLRHDFTDPAWDTRFLGDLYQDLSEHAKKTFALLQTPVFVEEFILGRTLDPAIATFGLAGTTVIDPTCGSGHFLLGAFARLFNRWVEVEPATNPRELARRSLDAIGGIDLNPFAASIARFRLLVAALRAGGDNRLADAPAYEIHIAVGDSLLHGDPPGSLPGMHTPGEEEALVSNHGYESEDIDDVRELLQKPWAVVVGNPPYILVKDAALNQAYRRRFDSCSGKYSLAVPFTERFWQLASHIGSGDRAGYIGMITANSFMKREMGKRLVTRWLPSHDLSCVVDTSGAYIPGHGTPTVLLFGRGRTPREETVRVVMGTRGEPGTPEDPAKGQVWTSIVALIDRAGEANDYISVSDVIRDRLHRHPWSIGGGGAAELRERLEQGNRQLGSFVDSIGFHAITGLDELFIGLGARGHVTGLPTRPFAPGEGVRDWRLRRPARVLFPYDYDGPHVKEALTRAVWPHRSLLRAGLMFGKTRADRGLDEEEFAFFSRERDQMRPRIAFAFMATHNHFVLTEGDEVFSQGSPLLVTRIRDERSLRGLAGLLNSSSACFAMKQVAFNKGSTVDARGARQTLEAYEDFFQFDGTKLKLVPVPASLPIETACHAISLSNLALSLSPRERVRAEGPMVLGDPASRCDFESAVAGLVGAQERLDWECYSLYGLIGEAPLTSEAEPEPPLQLGERAFEIVLARRMAAGEAASSWFARHGSEPIIELPGHWSPGYRGLVERRIDLIESDLNIGLIERPEFKRRWSATSWEEQASEAMEAWLLDRLEDRSFGPGPAAITTVARLTAEVRADEEFVSVARLHAGRDDIELAYLIGEMVKRHSVAYLAAHRHTDSGLRKNAAWLKVWELQRREDAGDDVGAIPTPPKYGKPDFNGVGWEHRGKLDVPKERFISYPGAERETDASMVIGWTGWNWLDRARALAAWYLQARRDGREASHLTPLLAGLAELVPWLKQWHDEPNPDPALDRPGTQIAALVEAEVRSLGLTPDDLSAWRPEKKRSGRPKKATT